MALRTAILFSGSQLGKDLGTLLAIGIVRLDGRYGIAGWRWLFLIEGVVTVGFAFVFAAFFAKLYPQDLVFGGARAGLVDIQLRIRPTTAR